MDDNLTEQTEEVTGSGEQEQLQSGVLHEKFNGDTSKLEEAYLNIEKQNTKQAQELAEFKKNQEAAKAETDDKASPQEKTNEGDNALDDIQSAEYKEAVVEHYGEGLAQVFDAAGVHAFSEWETFDETGALTDEAYDKLEKAGYGRDTVETYLAGYTAQRDQQVNGVLDKVGGQDGAAKLQAWLPTALSVEELEAHNEILLSNDITKINSHIDQLMSRYNESMGVEPGKTVQGDPQAGLNRNDVFRSTHELKEAMNDPRYAKDEAYRADVDAKLSRSNLFKRKNR